MSPTSLVPRLFFGGGIMAWSPLFVHEQDIMDSISSNAKYTRHVSENSYEGLKNTSLFHE